MRRFTTLPVLALPLLALLGCDPQIDQGLAEGLIESMLKKEGVSAESITCPKGEKAVQGNKFECTAKFGEVEVHFTMEVIDDKGTVYATPRDHTLVVEQVEPEIAEDLKGQGHEVASIDCHGDVWVAIKDATVSCDVTDEAGKAYLWTATFTDDEGTHEHKIEPK